MYQKPFALGVILLFLLSSFIPMVSSVDENFYYDIFFQQLPHSPNEPCDAFASDSQVWNEKIYETCKLIEINDLGYLTWWGIVLNFNYTDRDTEDKAMYYIDGSPEDMTFLIEFYNDNLGPDYAPPVDFMWSIERTIGEDNTNVYHTGRYYFGYELLKFRTWLWYDLFTDKKIWLSIQSIDDPQVDFFGWFTAKTGDNYSYIENKYPYHFDWDFACEMYARIIGGPPIEDEAITPLIKNWNLISIPYNRTITKNELHTMADGRTWTWSMSVNYDYINEYVFGWNRTNQNYEFVDNLRPGEGYFCYAYEDIDLWTTGYDPTSEKVITNLSEQWNLIGSPNEGTIEKTDIIVVDHDINYTWSEAVNNNLIVDYLFSWDRFNQSYNFIDTVLPGYGYWLYAYQPCVLKRSI